MSQSWVFIALALAANGMAGLAGALLSDRWLRRRQGALIGFAAGALLGTAFLDLLPACAETAGVGVLRWSFLGFIVAALIEWRVGHHHRAAGSGAPRAIPATVIGADVLHNVGDGAAIAAAFLISPGAGVTATFAVVAHEIPQEVGDYTLLRGAGIPRRRALLTLGLAQLSAVIGALAMLFAARSAEDVTPIVLALAAGSFIYVGATDLLPEIHSGVTPLDRRERLIGFLVGVAVVLVVSTWKH